VTEADMMEQPNNRDAGKLSATVAMRRFVDAVTGFGPRHGGWTTAYRKVRRVLTSKGLGGFLRRVQRYLSALSTPPDVHPWAVRLSCREAETLQSQCVDQPLLSLLIEAEPENLSRLNTCLESLSAQYYYNWQAILFAEQTESSIIADWLAGRTGQDSRISIKPYPPGAGNAAAYNAAAANASGEFMAVLDPTDTLTEDALSWVIVRINTSPAAVVIYSDSITLDERGKCVATQFKPDFSPEYLLASPFMQHLTFVRRSAFQQAAGFRNVNRRCLEHDLLLRLSELCSLDCFAHIPRTLCFQRAPGEIRDQDSSSDEAATTVIADALARRGLTGTVRHVASSPDVYSIRLLPRGNPKVTIFIPTRNAFGLMHHCVKAVREHTSWPNYEIVVINNQSDEPELLTWLDDEQKRGHLRVFDYDHPFNHSEMHNLAVAATDTDLVVLLNNDVQITSADWLEQMVATVESDPTIGGAGCLLLYPDGAVQHAGLLLGANGAAGHFHRDVDPAHGGANNRIRCLQEVSGCTAAFLMLKRSAWEAVGGFDADSFPISLNDVDLWFRLRRAGYRCIYDPLVIGVHDESRTRPIDDALETRDRLHGRWHSELSVDPFHNPNLGPESEQLSVFRDYPINVEGTIAELTKQAIRVSAARVA